MQQSNLFDVSNEVVIITGAGGQLGSEYVNAFLKNDARVVAIDLRSDNLKEFTSKFPDKFLFINADVTQKSDLMNALEKIISYFGYPTVLINNAALDSPPNAPLSENGPFEEYPEESWDKVMDVNVKSVFLTCQIFGGCMAKNGKGSIINISSIYGVVSPDQNIYSYRRKRGEVFYKPVAYSASKSALINLTRYLAVYWAKLGVRVNTLVLAGVFNNQEEEFLNAYNSRIPIGRMADKTEYNGTLLFLSSSASKYMTGSQITIDGGWTAI